MNGNFEDLKKRAAEYYANNKVPEKLEEILNEMFYEDPKDINGRLASYFEKFALPPTISDIKCTQILSTSGGSAIKCSVKAIVKNHSRLLESSQVSLQCENSHFQEQEYPENVDRSTTEDIFESNRKNINEYLSEKLKGISLLEQKEVDHVLSDWINDVENSIDSKPTPVEPDDRDDTTPTPSSGKKKKATSAKQKGGKGSDKPVPPREAPEDRAMGFSSIFAVSSAVLKSSSSHLQLDPFHHLHHVMSCKDGHATDREITMPAVAMTIFTGGKFAPGKLNLFKNVFLIASPSTSIRDSIRKLVNVYQLAGKPPSAKGTVLQTASLGAYQPSYDKLEQPLDALLEAINTSGLVPGQDVFIGLETAAQEIFDHDKGKYEVMGGALKTADDMVEMYKDLVARYPAIIMIIDPLRKEDREQWPKLCEMVSEKCFVIGGEAIYGSLHKTDINALTARPSSGVALRNSGRVTCSDLSRIVDDVRALSGVTMLTSPVDDACDDVYSDLAVGLGIDVIRFGAPSRAEQTSRMNRLVEIETSLEEDDIFRISYRKSFSFPIIKPPPPPPETTGAEESDPAPASTPDSKGKKK